MTTLSEVAKLAKVSVSTVSKVLNGAPGTRVSAETRARIEAAAATLKYRPNFAARSLKLARAQTLALLVPDLTNALFAPLVYGAEEEARKRGFTLILGRTEDLMTGALRIAEMASEGRIDGVIVQLPSPLDPVEFERVLGNSAPVVLINTVQLEGRPYAGLEDAAGARLATEHLIELGHRDIAFIGGGEGLRSSEERLSGYVSALEAHQIPRQRELETSRGFGIEQGAEAFGQLLQHKKEFSGVVVANVNAALGVLRAARESEFRVPDDLSVVALHDAVTAEHSWPPLTTVEMPLAELGARAVDKLLAAVGIEAQEGLKASAAPVLKVRASTATLRE